MIGRLSDAQLEVLQLLVSGNELVESDGMRLTSPSHLYWVGPHPGKPNKGTVASLIKRGLARYGPLHRGWPASRNVVLTEAGRKVIDEL